MSGSHKKVVYYSPAGRIQNSERELINYPPDGYEFLTGKVNPLIRNDFIFDKMRLKVFDKMMPLNLAKAFTDNPPKCDMIYAYNHIVPQKVPWCVNVEWANVLVGRDIRYFNQFKKVVEKYLSLEWCKGIFTWTDKAMESILNKYDCTKFSDKLKVVSPAVHSKNYERDYTKAKKILFIGSIDTPEDFYAKGGIETLMAFNLLKHQYNLELIIRAKAPLWVGGHGIRVIRDILPKDEFENLFKQADIFVFPSHYAHEMVVLEAMSWGLPVITSWVATFGEYISNGVDGIILSSPDIDYIKNGWLVSETTDRLNLLKQVSKSSKSATNIEIANNIESLINNQSLREKIGKSAKEKADKSISMRNNILKGTFDKC